ncbi:TadE/TadG family type IV pilus assembly protein [Erythrobacter sp. QSSC1-22B]|uniref:TadE/TadG family type IV pilus assembly protein n=1 Tax=Erythrobacter sp. QSSC1-22B TaxID=1860125 RepID=UPI001F227D0A|nr:TadE/TadG family type IV pilus assembly protein [Erythrobacter sp. QSSC1-22B]
MGARNFLRRVGRDEEGVTIVEFAILLLPFLIIVMGGLELGYKSYVRAIAQGAMSDAARRASVQSPTFNASGDALEERIENSIAAQLDTVAIDGDYDISQRRYFDFSDVGNPERIMRDNNGNGQYDASDNDCFEDFNQNGDFDLDAGSAGIAGASDVVFYEVMVELPRLFPFAFLGQDIHRLTLQTAIRNQPYANQPTPPTLCGV